MRFLACAALVLATLTSSLAAAQDAREQARALFEEASRQFDAGNYQLALDGFERSREMVASDPRASSLILFNIGRCHEELGRLRPALDTFERYLMESPADAPFRDETQDHVRDLRARIAAEGGSDPSPATESGTSPLVLVGAIVLGVGGLTALASIPTGILALDGAARLEETCPGGACPPNEAGTIDDTHTLGVVTDVLWATGLGVAAVGGVLLALGLTSGGSEDTAAIRPGFGCTGTGCTATLSGRL